MKNWNILAAASLLSMLAFPLYAQLPPSDAVAWKSSAVAVKSADGGKLYRLQFEGHIAPGYIIYGSDFEAGLGPNPTRLRLDAKEGITARDKLQSAGTKAGKDAAFNSAYTYFEGAANLSQLVAVADGVKSVAGTLRGQACHESDGTCTLFSVHFEVPLPPAP
jgi:hypothetical protein